MEDVLGRIGAYVRRVDPDGKLLAIPDDLDVDYVLDELIPVGQDMVGRLWEGASWSVSQEHEASEEVLWIIEALSRMEQPRSTSRRLLLACAEGEWHNLAVTALALGFARHGWEVRVARPATRAAQLAALIHDFGAHVVAVSCSMEANLPGARKMVAGAYDTGTATLAGGRAFGSTEGRARLIGATAWAPNLREALLVVEPLAFATPRPAPLTHRYADEFRLIESRSREIADNLSVVLDLGEHGDLSTVELTAWTMRNLAAALLCGEPDMMSDVVAWIDRRSTAAGTPDSEFVLSALLRALPAEAEVSRRLLGAA